MKILEYIAQDIAERTTAILGYPISITDKAGYIIGSTDRSRLGIFHQPSLEVLKKNGMINCETEEEKKILPGVSVPIMFNNKAIGVLGIVGNPEEVETYVQLVKSQVEMMCQEAFRKEMMDLESKMIEVFVQQMIHFENDENAKHILQYTKTLDYDLEINRTCILIDINMLSSNLAAKKGSADFSDKLSFPYFQREVSDFLTLIFRESKADILSFLNVERFIIIKSIKSEEAYNAFIKTLEQKLGKLNNFLQSKYGFSAAISVGDLKNGLRGIAESYRNATKAMLVGKKTDQAPSIYLYNDWDITLKLIPKELAPDLQKKLLQTVKPLLEQDNYEILASTFITYCKYNMNLSETARNMYIHRNTIIYRLQKIGELTSLNTNAFEQCMLLYMAMRYYEEGKG